MTSRFVIHAAGLGASSFYGLSDAEVIDWVNDGAKQLGFALTINQTTLDSIYDHHPFKMEFIVPAIGESGACIGRKMICITRRTDPF